MEDPPSQLGACAEQLFGRECAQDGASIPFIYLQRIHDELTAPTGTHLALSSEQERSFWMLWEWWNSYKASFQVPPDAPPTDYRRHLVDEKYYELDCTSGFSAQMRRHLACEFDDGPPKHSMSALWEARQHAASQCACQHVGKACLRYWMCDKGVTHVYVQDPAKKHHLDYYTALDGTVKDFVSSQQSGLIRKRIAAADLCGLDAKCTSGASCGSCPWLPSDDGLPFYLWDTHENRTVEVESIGHRPAYVAISHTWGRWRKPNREKSIPGVDGWAVPENEIFDVGELHRILSSFPIDIRYVWFDLVCIPQDGSERASIEIARQAAIFKNARHCMIWFNTIESWSGLREAVELMAVQFVTDNVVQSAHVQDLPTELFEAYNYSPGINNDTLSANGWFTSLWTLQEICLRPDMWLCNKSMELFTVAGETVPVALNTIAALSFFCTQLQSAWAVVDEDDPPMLDISQDMVSPEAKFGKLIGRNGFQRGYLELAELFERTGMDRLHTIGRGQIVLLGSTRFCSENRADAIMSVLGATRWRLASDAREDLHSPKSLVLEQYPLAFVREVFAAQGASFFSVMSASSARIGDVFAGTYVPRGSILPFARVGSAVTETKFNSDWEFPGETYNPLVSRWTIQLDGSVRILKASVVTSTDDHEEDRLIASVWHTYSEPLQLHSLGGRFEGSGRRMCSVDLRDWCKNYFPATANFAVELSNVEGLSRGILLKELTAGSKEMFKVGNYNVSPMNRSFWKHFKGPMLRDVDWIAV